MRQGLKNILTEKDNITYDAGRVLWVAGTVAFICFTGYQVFRQGTFDASSYGIGLGSLLTGGGAGLGLKSREGCKDGNT